MRITKAIALPALVLLIAAVAVGAALRVVSRGESGTVFEVVIKGFQFSPADLEIHPGDTVRWVNRDFILHTVTSQTGQGTLIPSGDFDSEKLDYEGMFTFTFTQPGEFYYFCHPHGSSMQGVVRVVPPALCSADLTGDQRVDTADLVVLLGNFGHSGPGLAGDFNTDGTVNTADLTVLLGQYGCGV